MTTNPKGHQIRFETSSRTRAKDESVWHAVGSIESNTNLKMIRHTALPYVRLVTDHITYEEFKRKYWKRRDSMFDYGYYFTVTLNEVEYAALMLEYA